jgi:hypothetical protein
MDSIGRKLLQKPALAETALPNSGVMIPQKVGNHHLSKCHVILKPVCHTWAVKLNGEECVGA